MEKMLTELCHEVNNYFRREIHSQTFSVVNGSLVGIPEGFLQQGQYFRVIGSIFNDGVHKYPATDMKNESSFNGAIWALAIPQEFQSLCAEIEAWNEKYGGAESAAMSPFNSESFGGYSYSKSSSFSSSSSDTDKSTWQGVFDTKLRKWRRMRCVT